MMKETNSLVFRFWEEDTLLRQPCLGFRTFGSRIRLTACQPSTVTFIPTIDLIRFLGGTASCRKCGRWLLVEGFAGEEVVCWLFQFGLVKLCKKDFYPVFRATKFETWVVVIKDWSELVMSLGLEYLDFKVSLRFEGPVGGFLLPTFFRLRP